MKSSSRQATRVAIAVERSQALGATLRGILALERERYQGVCSTLTQLIGEEAARRAAEGTNPAE